MAHPYDNLPPKAFWRSAVGEQDPRAIQDIWRPKFMLAPDEAVSTAGSCFAQHIGRALAARGFNWLEAEPTPYGLSDGDRRNFGYGIFSFRTSNIYTAAMLRQWIEWAFDKSKPPSEVWEEGGRFFDPFRPTIEPDGFTSEEELLASRATTLAAIRLAVRQSAVFTFTLGLTESWINLKDGHVYAACPGTQHGRFDASLHAFKNFKHCEILADLTAAFEVVREANPALRILLTVSPVPLTATASDKHVLVATTYSKSVLRAVAGEYVEDRPYADYFPSYELITGAPFRAEFYRPDLRSVTSDGVSFVMEKFFQALYGDQPVPRARRKKPAAGTTQDDVVCEEELLEQFDNA